jgi:hypothetical protein
VRSREKGEMGAMPLDEFAAMLEREGATPRLPA